MLDNILRMLKTLVIESLRVSTPDGVSRIVYATKNSFNRNKDSDGSRPVFSFLETHRPGPITALIAIVLQAVGAHGKEQFPLLMTATGHRYRYGHRHGHGKSREGTLVSSRTSQRMPSGET